MKLWQQRKQRKLYRQWTKHADLPSEAVLERRAERVSSSPEAVPEGRRGRIGLTRETFLSPEVPTDVKAWMEEENRFYRFRVRILDIVRKILRVD